MSSKRLSVAAIAATSALLISGCGGSTDSEGEDTASTLAVYCALPEEECNDYLGDFSEESGIKVESVRLSAGEILARVESEAANPNASVWFGGSTDNFINAAEKDLLQQYLPEDIDMIPEMYHDKDEYWTPFYVGAIGIATNSDWLEEEGLDAPTSWDDLLAPEYEENVMIAHPSSSGTAYTTLAAFVQLWGEDDAFAYLRDLNKNIRHYTNSGTAPASEAGIGEVHAGISFSHDILATADEGYPIELSFPTEGVGSEVGAVAIINGIPDSDRKAAETFIDWTISENGQNSFAKDGWYRLPVRDGAEVPEGAQPVSEVNLVDYDPKWAADNRDELLARFASEIADQSEAEGD